MLTANVWVLAAKVPAKVNSPRAGWALAGSIKFQGGLKTGPPAFSPCFLRIFPGDKGNAIRGFSLRGSGRLNFNIFCLTFISILIILAAVHDTLNPVNRLLYTVYSTRHKNTPPAVCSQKIAFTFNAMPFEVFIL